MTTSRRTAILASLLSLIGIGPFASAQATRPAAPPTTRPTVYLWTGPGSTRYPVAAPVVAAATWHWGKSDPAKASAFTLGGTLKAAEAYGYAAPIAVDEGWSLDQIVTALDSGNALASCSRRPASRCPAAPDSQRAPSTGHSAASHCLAGLCSRRRRR